MNSVGIDVSKGKSMIAVMRPFGEIVVTPYEVRHTSSELGELHGTKKNISSCLWLIYMYTFCSVSNQCCCS